MSTVNEELFPLKMNTNDLLFEIFCDFRQRNPIKCHKRNNIFVIYFSKRQTSVVLSEQTAHNDIIA